MTGTERRRNLWPLPGGVGAYSSNLRALVRAVGNGASRTDLEGLVAELAPTVRSATTVRGYAAVPVTLGLVERHTSGALKLTRPGTRYARTGDLAVVREALVERVLGVEEILSELADGSSTYRALTQRLASHGISWNYAMAIRYRVWWLTAAAAIEPSRQSRVDDLSLTDSGRRLLARRNRSRGRNGRKGDRN